MTVRSNIAKGLMREMVLISGSQAVWELRQLCGGKGWGLAIRDDPLVMGFILHCFAEIFVRMGGEMKTRVSHTCGPTTMVLKYLVG